MQKFLFFFLCISDLVITQSWNFYGRDLKNSHWAFESEINTHNVHSLTQAWNFTCGAVSEIPTVSNGVVYFTSFDGFLYALNAESGALLWSVYLPDYSGNNASFSRNSPSLSGDYLVIGDQASATVYAFHRFRGTFLWKTLVDDHPAALITSSPSIFETKVLVGVSSEEESLAALVANYSCCSFRGSFLSLDLLTGAINWKRYTVPDNFNGGSVWGSSPSVDPLRNSVYIGTGNNYFLSTEVEECLQEGRGNCVPADNYAECMMSLNLDTGQINWVHYFDFEAGFIDAWTYACTITVPNPQNCPPNPGDDWDFAQMPMLFSVQLDDSRSVDAVGAGQKSGLFITLNRDDGSLIWSTMVGPGGTSGGILWSSAVDNHYVYTSISNAGDPKNYTVDGMVINYGSFAALDKNTGRIVWQVPDPGQSYQYGGVTLIGDVVFGPSILSGTLFGLDSHTGAVLWSYTPPPFYFLASAPSGDTKRIYLGAGFQADVEMGAVFAFKLPEY